MSARYFCDRCGVELDSRSHKRIKRQLGPICVEVLVAVDAIWNGGHACTKCVVEAVQEGKDVEYAEKQAVDA